VPDDLPFAVLLRVRGPPARAKATARRPSAQVTRRIQANLPPR